MFQHTLQPEGWSDPLNSGGGTLANSFNTRSSRRAGATLVRLHGERIFLVSTHAPAGGLERPSMANGNGDGDLFQHTLQPEGWSDKPKVTSICLPSSFQHTLQPEGWSDACLRVMMPT